MPLHFRGGELQQKGKGIGGFFRIVSSVLKPLVKRVGQSVLNAATSSTGKAIGRAISEQALQSTLNMTHDYLSGNSLSESLENEKKNIKEKAKTILSKQRGRGAPKQKRVVSDKAEIKKKFKGAGFY